MDHDELGLDEIRVFQGEDEGDSVAVTRGGPDGSALVSFIDDEKMHGGCVSLDRETLVELRDTLTEILDESDETADVG